MSKVKRRNQFGEEADGHAMGYNDWCGQWEAGKTKFHMPRVHPMLQKYYNTLVDGHRTPVTVFLPMCGKSLDIKWLAEKGHKVIGNEFVELGCRQFFQDHEIPYEESSLKQPLGKIFKSTHPSLDITLYCCDFFLLTKDVVGDVGAIWDRGSLAATHFDLRPRYCSVILDLMSSSTRYLVSTFRMAHDIFAGPPYTLPCQEFERLLGLSGVIFIMTKQEERDALTDWQRSWGLDWFIEDIHLITKPSAK